MVCDTIVVDTSHPQAWLLNVWRMKNNMWLRLLQTSATPNAAAPPAPPSRPPRDACGVADPAVLHLLDTLHDPATAHDERWSRMERAVSSPGDACTMRTLYSATSRHSLEVERMRAQQGAVQPSGAQLWSVQGTDAVVAQEGALRDALFMRIYEQLASRDCRDNHKCD